MASSLAILIRKSEPGTHDAAAKEEARVAARLIVTMAKTGEVSLDSLSRISKEDVRRYVPDDDSMQLAGAVCDALREALLAHAAAEEALRGCVNAARE